MRRLVCQHCRQRPGGVIAEHEPSIVREELLVQAVWDSSNAKQTVGDVAELGDAPSTQNLFGPQPSPSRSQ